MGTYKPPDFFDELTPQQQAVISAPPLPARGQGNRPSTGRGDDRQRPAHRRLRPHGPARHPPVPRDRLRRPWPATRPDPRGEAVLRHCPRRGGSPSSTRPPPTAGGGSGAPGWASVCRAGGTRVVICTKVLPGRGTPPPKAAPGTASPSPLEFLRQQCEASLRRAAHGGDRPLPAAPARRRYPARGPVRAYAAAHRRGPHPPLGGSPTTRRRAVRALLESAEAGGHHPSLRPGGLLHRGRHQGPRRRPRAGPPLRGGDVPPCCGRGGLGLLAFGPHGPRHPGAGRARGEQLPPGDDDRRDRRCGGRAGASAGPRSASHGLLSHPEVTCVLGGAETPAHVDEMIAGTRLAAA